MFSLKVVALEKKEFAMVVRIVTVVTALTLFLPISSFAAPSDLLSNEQVIIVDPNPEDPTCFALAAEPLQDGVTPTALEVAAFYSCEGSVPNLTSNPLPAAYSSISSCGGDVAYPAPQDFTPAFGSDGVVDYADYYFLREHWGSNAFAGTGIAGADGVIGFEEYLIWLANFGREDCEVLCDPARLALDLNGDLNVGTYELDEVIEHFGTANSEVDFNGNGEVDFGDLLLVLANWGEC